MSTTLESYDQLHFSSKPHPGRHPARLAVIARLFGHESPEVDGARVLELGCGNGANLLPMATELPRASLVGIDLSRAQIESGDALAKELGIANLRLVHGSIGELAPDLGDFDYIMCHGVFSWVDRATQEAILRICRERLRPDGVACVSYNTLPGWNIRGIVREFLRWSDVPSSAPPQRIETARNALAVLGESLGYERFYSLLLQTELDRLKREPDSYLFHEMLAEINEPLQFREFVRRASVWKLAYLGDARFSKILHRRLEDVDLPAETCGRLAMIASSPVELEQYLDYILNTGFRETILCREEVRIRREVRSDTLLRMRVAANLSALPEQLDPNAMEFADSRGQPVMIAERLHQIALTHLAERWPEAPVISELIDRTGELAVREGRSCDPSEIEAQICALVLSLFGRDLIELYIQRPLVAQAVPERPCAPLLARLQAGSGSLVVNLRHETISLGDLEREIVGRLDGRSGRQELLEHLLGCVRDGRLTVAEDGEAVTDADQQRRNLEIVLEDGLKTLLRAALILPEGFESGALPERQAVEADGSKGARSFGSRLFERFKKRR